MVDVNLSEFGTMLGAKFGIGAFAGGLLMGLILVIVVMFPLVMIGRRRGSSFMAESIGGFALYGFNVAVGWWPPWMLIILAFLAALIFYEHFKD